MPLDLTSRGVACALSSPNVPFTHTSWYGRVFVELGEFNNFTSSLKRDGNDVLLLRFTDHYILLGMFSL